MARRTNAFEGIRSEGGLLPPDLLRRLDESGTELPGTAPRDYGLAEGERLTEAITQSWNRLLRSWVSFRRETAALPDGEPGLGVTNERWSLPLLRELGFGVLPTGAGPEIGGRVFPIARFSGPTPIHLVGCGVPLDRRSAGVRGAAGGNPHGLVQEFLNRSPHHLWAIVGNGLRFRILRDNVALSRQSYLEFDLEAIFDGRLYADFVLLWLVAHATRFMPRDGSRPDSCVLEQWTRYAQQNGTRALEDLKVGVAQALQILGQGFVGNPANRPLRDRLRSGALPLADLHAQLLRVVYRLIFLFVAEDRTIDGLAVIHPRDPSDAGAAARHRYATHYGTARLRTLARSISGSRHGDLWRQFGVLVGALAGSPAHAAARSALGLPVLGSFLWDPASTPDLNPAGIADGAAVELSNADLLEAIRHLAYTKPRDSSARRPVDYRNLGAEELGGVYETLLALTPQIDGGGERFSFAEFAGNERKTSGSYYTPDSLVQCLLDSALDPVVEEAIAGKPPGEAVAAILDLKVCDPAVGSGHFLVGAAHRLAGHLARQRALQQGESEPSPLLYQQALRDVIGRCLYGIDINPMAAELCRVSLWLDALEPGKPLSFLDHHIQVGNSLLGATPALIAAGIPEGAFAPVEGDDRKVCSALKKANKAEREALRKGDGLLDFGDRADSSLADQFRTIDAVEDDTPEAVARRSRTYRGIVLSDAYLNAKLVADAWCAAFFWRKDGRQIGGVKGITERLFREIESHPHRFPRGNAIRDEIERLAAHHQFFHLHLAFPEVYAPQAGAVAEVGR